MSSMIDIKINSTLIEAASERLAAIWPKNFEGAMTGSGKSWAELVAQAALEAAEEARANMPTMQLLQPGEYLVIFDSNNKFCPGHATPYVSKAEHHDEAAVNELSVGRHPDGNVYRVLGHRRASDGRYLDHSTPCLISYTIRVIKELPPVHSEECNRLGRMAYEETGDSDNYMGCECPTFPEGTSALTYYELERLPQTVWPSGGGAYCPGVRVLG